MIVLSTKLQECMALNTGGTFLKFVSNVIIADHATKKRKVVAAPSGSAPPKYRIKRCTTTAPPTHLTSRSSINTSVRSNSALPAHLSAHTSRQHPRLYLRWSHLRPHLLQLWSPRPLHSRLPHAKEECRSGPRHSFFTRSIEGGHCKDWSRQLHHYGGHYKGRASPREYVFFKQTTCGHSV
jgi:hypothetical protein